METKEQDIAISDYPLLQTEFLYASKKGTADCLLEIRFKSLISIFCA